MKRLRLIAFFFSLCLLMPCVAQDVKQVKAIVESLSSSQFYGRGYINQGCNKAADFISSELSAINIEPLIEGYKQFYPITVNTFPSKVEVKVGKKQLLAGIDFVIHPACKSVNNTFSLVWLPSGLQELDSVYLLVDTTKLNNKIVVFPRTLEKYYMRGVKGIKNAIFLSDNCSWHTSQKAVDMCYIKMKENTISKKTKKVRVSFESKLEKDYEVSNVAGIVRSAQPTDSLIVFTAHYDHLGMMGDVMFGGANDNASGTAVLLRIANYAASHRNELTHNVAFVFVSGEEVGLCGSVYNSQHPLFDLNKVSLLINLDMVGSGSEGITIVNGKCYPHVVELFNRINKDQDLGIDIALRGESCNSDHCPYYRLGVPSVFIYTRGNESPEYHAITDSADKLPFTIYDNFLKLMLGLINR